MLLGICAEEPANNRDVADDRRAVLGLLHIFAHQTAEHDCLPVPDADASRDFAGTEDRLIDDVRRQDNALVNSRNCGRSTEDAQQSRINCTDWAPIIDEALELDHLRHEVQVNRHAIGTDDRFDLQSHAGVARFESGRCGRADHWEGN